MTLNNANRKSIRLAEKAAALAEANHIAYTKQIMSTPFGREWMLKLLTDCCMFQNPLRPGFADVTAFNIGKQDLGRPYYNEIITYSPSDYALMLSEASIKDSANDRRNDDSQPSTDPRYESSAEGFHGDPTQSRFTVDHDGFVHDDTPIGPGESVPADDPRWN